MILKDRRPLDYDCLVVATGSRIAPDEIEGLAGTGWGSNIFDFYTSSGAVALAHFLRYWKGGKMVVNVAEMPIKCPVAPLEFMFLADWWFTVQGMRDRVEIEFVTPLDGAFTKPIASRYLGEIVARKGIKIVPDFAVSAVNAEKNTITSYDGREVGFDLLVSVPTNMGAPVIERAASG